MYEASAAEEEVRWRCRGRGDSMEDGVEPRGRGYRGVCFG
jgi:hypothetical protein